MPRGLRQCGCSAWFMRIFLKCDCPVPFTGSLNCSKWECFRSTVSPVVGFPNIRFRKIVLLFNRRAILPPAQRRSSTLELSDLGNGKRTT